MNIVIVGRGIPSHKYPLNGIFEFDQAKALSMHENVTYIAIDLRSFRRKRKWGVREYYDGNLRIIEVNIPCGRIPHRILIKVGTTALKKVLEKYFKNDVIDIMHAHFTDIAIIASNTIEDNVKHFIITEHSSLIRSMDKRNLKYDIIKKAYEKADAVIGVSSSFVRYINDLFGVDAVCIGNVIDLSSFCYQYRLNYNKEDCFSYVTTARLVKGKRIDLLIEAFSLLKDENKNVKLHIVGDGPERHLLETKIEEKGLTSSIIMHGKMQKKTINEIYGSCHCFVLPSLSETFGVAYVEALATGLPIIATKCGGPEDFIDNTNGIAIEINNLKELKDAMDYIRDNYNNYSQKNIANDVCDTFSPDNISNKLMSLYRKVVSENNYCCKE